MMCMRCACASGVRLAIWLCMLGVMRICVCTTCSQPTFCWIAAVTPTAATTISRNGSHHDVLRRMSLNVAVGATNVSTTRSNSLKPRVSPSATPSRNRILVHCVPLASQSPQSDCSPSAQPPGKLSASPQANRKASRAGRLFLLLRTRRPLHRDAAAQFLFLVQLVRLARAHRLVASTVRPAPCQPCCAASLPHSRSALRR